MQENEAGKSRIVTVLFPSLLFVLRRRNVALAKNKKQKKTHNSAIVMLFTALLLKVDTDA